MKSSGIGGQAVIEGVMMKNKDRYSVAVRKPDQVIEVKVEEYHGVLEKYSIFKHPILRGIGTFIEALTVGMQTLTYSAGFYEEEEKKPSKLEETMGKLFKEKAESALMGITIVLSVLLAVAVFMILPFFLAGLFSNITKNPALLALLEGVLRMAIFILYIVGISQLQDIKRTFMYHGAEHKTINCVESGKELTISNVRSQSRYHKRCGTSFLFIVMFISILFFMVIQVNSLPLRLVLRILLIPVIAGISYEFIRFAGTHDNATVKILSKPGMWLQSLTTREPEDDMIEVAIRSVDAVFDWRAYQEEAKTGKTEKDKSKADKTVLADTPIEDMAATKEDKEATSKTAKIQVAKKAQNSRTVRAAKRERERILSEEENRKDKGADSVRSAVLLEDEDDDILKALDKYFDEN
jgi:uncharacterized protein YqhQ